MFLSRLALGTAAIVLMGP
ncbi:hypothetical protein ACNVD4_07065, partial [Rhizobium sp. BR5]